MNTQLTRGVSSKTIYTFLCQSKRVLLDAVSHRSVVVTHPCATVYPTSEQLPIGARWSSEEQRSAFTVPLTKYDPIAFDSVHSTPMRHGK